MHEEHFDKAVAFCGSPILRIGEPLGTQSPKQKRYAFCPKT